VSATPFYLAHQGLNDKDIQILVANIFKYLSKDLTYVAPHVTKKARGRTVRIGFISNHFRDHSIGRIMIEVMNLMRVMNNSYGSAENREIHVYSICKKYVPHVVTAEDAAIDEEFDHIASQMQAAFSTKFVRFPMNVQYIREQIAKDELDVLIFADIGMDFVSYLLSFARLAHLQVRKKYQYLHQK
jgi:predicted O-linked N-acetylglucosamine transferase (SPINDLY family)